MLDPALKTSCRYLAGTACIAICFASYKLHYTAAGMNKQSMYLAAGTALGRGSRAMTLPRQPSLLELQVVSDAGVAWTLQYMVCVQNKQQVYTAAIGAPCIP